MLVPGDLADDADNAEEIEEEETTSSRR